MSNNDFPDYDMIIHGLMIEKASFLLGLNYLSNPAIDAGNSNVICNRQEGLFGGRAVRVRRFIRCREVWEQTKFEE
jgi:hypothetical protein